MAAIISDFARLGLAGACGSLCYPRRSVNEPIATDFIVVGSGIAGLRAAIEIATAQREVVLLTKDLPTDSNTEYAQGGIAAALGEEDEIALHERDTIAAGDGLCDPEAVRILVEEGPR